MRRAYSQRGTTFFLLVALSLYWLIIGPFTAYMNGKPIEEKLGYVPSGPVLKTLAAGMNELSSAALVAKVMMYFGGLSESRPNRVERPPDYSGMTRFLEGAVTLDPYNMDAYYIAQAFVVWDTDKVLLTNALLDNGMKHRTWDWYLPFFAGFNSAYFLKDYEKASAYYMKAADLTGAHLFVKLAGRYMQEAGQTEMAIDYLNAMLATARGDLAKKGYALRLSAFEAVLQIEQAVNAFLNAEGSLPANIDELLNSGYLEQLPQDPYGGTFYLQDDGKVMTTSKFAFGAKAELSEEER